MRRNPPSLTCRIVSAALFCCALTLQAQVDSSPRVTQAVSDTATTVLSHSTSPMIRTALDAGATSAALPMNRMLLLLKPSDAQSSALETRLTQLQDSKSPHFHQWLTPEQYGAAYGPALSDIDAVTKWLQSQGFTVDSVATGRRWIEFSGSVAQVETAFHTQIRNYSVASKLHVANATDLKIPVALAPVIAGLVSVNDFLSLGAHTTPAMAPITADASGSNKGLDPQAFAAIYNLKPLYEAGIDGSAQTIAIPSRSDLDVTDVQGFRRHFSLPDNDPHVVLNGPDPGQNIDEAQATIDATWSGAVAPKASVQVVVSGSTHATDGVDLSIAYIVDHALAHVISTNYVACEANLGPLHSAFYAAAWQQAAAEGMTSVVATGDSGAAACEDPANNALLTSGYGVNGIASTAWNTVVGGTALADSAVPSSSAVAEEGWNELPSAGSHAAGGGVSNLTAAPKWQIAAGVPGRDPNTLDQHHRYLPDVALASSAHDTYAAGYDLCLAGSCQQGSLVHSAGTGFASAAFAGMMALVDEYTHSPQGNAAPTLYALARQAGAIRDVTSGSHQLACVAGITGCSQTDGVMGYVATTGYDLATGLGSVDATAMVHGWADAALVGTTQASIVLSSPTTEIPISNPLTINVLATPASGAGNVPTGTVTLVDDVGGTLNTLNTLQLSSGVAGYTVPGNTLSAGTHLITGQYSGDPTYGATNSSPLTLLVDKAPLTIVVSPASATPNAGSTMTVTATLIAANSPAPTGSVSFTVDGATVAQGALSGSGLTVSASAQITVPAAGPHTIGATYPGEGIYPAISATPVTINVQTAGATIVVTPSTLTPSAGTTMSATATLTSPQSPAPTGSVSFLVDGTQVAIGTLSGTGTTSTVTVQFPAPTAGAHTIGAVYAGDNVYKTVTATPVSINAVQPAATIVITPSSLTPIFGSTVTATVTVSSTQTPAPSGTVNFLVDSTPLSAAVLTSTGLKSTASVDFPAPSVGVHTIEAVYAGDTVYKTITATPATITVAKGQSAVTLVALPVAITPDTPETFTATITDAVPSTQTLIFTGNMVFFDGTLPLAGQVLVASNQAVLTGITLDPTVTHSITAKYFGDGQWITATSAALVLKALVAVTTVSVSASSATSLQGSLLTLTSTVNETSSITPTITPTGNVFFYDGATPIGQTTLSTYLGLATAYLYTTNLSPGIHPNITAVYQGDANFQPSTTNAISVTIEGYTVTPDVPTVTFTAGQPANVIFDVSPIAGLTVPVQFSCQAPGGTETTCLFSPASVTGSGQAIMTVTTGARSTAAAGLRRPGSPWLTTSGGVALAALLLGCWPIGRRGHRLLSEKARRTVLIALLLVGGLSAGLGCGSARVTGTTPIAGGTPAGSQVLDITSTATLNSQTVNQHTYFTIVVQ
jgi:subtilase family serine protease